MYQLAEKRKSGSRSVIQTSLKIGQPGDKYEQEADAVAEKVMMMSDSDTVQMQPVEEEEDIMQPKLRMQPIEEEEMIQTMSENDGGVASPEVVQQLNSTKGSGQPISTETNQFMGKAFGADFSGVKIHAGSDAVQMNQQLGARAFTHGNDIYFNNSEYNPESSNGKRLLAHELTHVAQQNGGIKRYLIQRDLRSDFSNQWGPAQTQLNVMYGGIGGVIDRQKGAVTDFLRYAQVPDQPSLAEQVIINGINIALGAVIPGVGSIIKSAAQSLVRESLRGAMGSIVDSMVDAGKGALQGAVTNAWSQTAGVGTAIVQYAETQRRALEEVAQSQISSMNRELARLLSTEGDTDEWEAGNALYESFKQSLTSAYNEQFNKMTDIWFTMQNQTVGGGARPGVLRITLTRQYPNQRNLRVESANLLGSGSVSEIRRRLGQRRLQDIAIPKYIEMNGQMGMGIMDCAWNINVTGQEPPSSHPTISAPHTRLESLMAGAQRVTGYGGHRTLGWPWLAAYHLNIEDLGSDDSRNSDANRSAGATEIWNAIKNLTPGTIDASSW